MKMKIKFIYLLVLFVCHFSNAMDLRVEYSPKTPRAGESLQIFFIVSGDDLEHFKDIEFEPSGFEVMSKDSQVTNSRTTYVNGKLTRFQSQTISYEVFVGEEQKEIKIKNLLLVTDTNKINYSDIDIKVEKASVNKDIFAKAILNKDKIYKGEGVLVTYYLFTRNASSSPEIKKFPILKNFLKRFRQERVFTERVTYNGIEYNRTYLYSAYVFPQKSGVLEIDPITISARVEDDSSGGDRFDVFGFSFTTSSRRSLKTVRSAPVNIKVLPLPLPIPRDFSGLVGAEHQFQFSINKDRFLANEPIEIKLSVTGDGELEAFDAPALFDESHFEKFDSNGKLAMGNYLDARKEFSYTYLAKKSGEYKEREINFSTFNTSKNTYEKKKIVIPALKVAGGVAGANQGKFVSGSSASSSTSLTSGEGVITLDGSSAQVEGATIGSGVSAPYFYYSDWVEGFVSMLPRFFFFILCIIILFYYFKTKRKTSLSLVEESARKLQGKKWRYSDLYNFLDFLREGNDEGSLPEAIEKSNLTPQARKYFIDILGALGQKEFANTKLTAKLTLRQNYINEVIKKSLKQD